MPLQNRVTPEGDIIAAAARGTMMGNRGGAIHTPERALGSRRWRTKAWICCVLEFKGRHRVVMSPSRYTELFFLDEATALAAGHRPCFECRRQDALRFAEAWRLAHGLPIRPRAAEMDNTLHRQRTTSKAHAPHEHTISGLPDGVIVRWHGVPHLHVAGHLIVWTATGYGPAVPMPTRTQAEVITPLAIVAALAAGYRAMIHPTATAALSHVPGEIATQ